MRLSSEVEIALSLAASEAARRHHEFITVEHFLYALLFDESGASIVMHAGADPKVVRAELDEILSAEIEPVPEDVDVSPTPSIGVERTIRRAALHVQSAGKDEITIGNILVAMFSEPDSHAVRILNELGVTRLDVISFITHGVSNREEDDDVPVEAGQAAPAPTKDPLEAYTVNLNEEARQSRIDPLVGRESEVDRIVHILARRKKNNPLLIGDSGVGKTAIVEGLALRIVRGDVPESLRSVTIYSLDVGSLIAGTRFRGDFEDRVKSIVSALQKLDGAIIFIDEIHTIIGAGSTSGGSMDASNLLKPALASGRLRCIGSTTFQEYRSHFERDRALVRRFQRIDVAEPSIDDTVKILEGLKRQYEEFHGVTITPAAVEAAAQLAARYMHDRKLPDKAIDLLDEAAAAVKLRGGDSKTVDLADVEQVVARVAHVPPRDVVGDDKTRLRELEPAMRAAIFGQDDAIAQLVSAIKLQRAGLRSADKPTGSFLFTGPTGVGKTEVAKVLARVLGVAFVRFDMSEYMERHAVSRLIGAPPGYVGFEQGGLLTDAIAKTPHAVLLLDEIEKAHPDVFNVLLQVMDHGMLTDNNGKSTDFKHVLLLMTSNVGARDLAKHAVGFGDIRQSADADREYKLMFSPEFRNRLDARIMFAPLSASVMELIVDKYIRELRDQLAERNVTIELTAPARDYLATRGYDPDNGARPLARLIQDEVKRPLSEELLFGRLEHGGAVDIDLADGKLAFHFRQAAS